MIDAKLSILAHIAVCDRVGEISGPKAYATAAALSKALPAYGDRGVRDAIRELHTGGFIACPPPFRTRAPARLVLTEKGRAMLGAMGMPT